MEEPSVLDYLKSLLNPWQKEKIHIPEDDEQAAPSADLAERKQILSRLQQRWQTIAAAKEIRHVTLHYLNGAIHVEVILPLDYFTSLEEARACAKLIAEAGEKEEDVHAVKVLFTSH